LPMDTPTRDFASHFTDGILEGIDTRGNLAMVVQVQPPHDVGGLDTALSGTPQSRGTRNDPKIPSNTVTGGVVKSPITSNDSIRKAFLIARNLYSPTSHANDENRCAASARIPVAATIPSKDRGMPPKYSRRGTGGNYTIPAPQVVPSWPTSAQWLASRIGSRINQR